MSMTNKEKFEMDALRWELCQTKALRLTEPVEEDVPVPTNGKTINGWLYHVYRNEMRVEKSCTSSISHSFGNWDKATSQGARKLYSSELLASRAGRAELARQCAIALASADKRIDLMLADQPQARG